MGTLEIAFAIVLVGGVPVVFVLVLPLWWLNATRKGLRTRTRRPFVLQTSDDVLVLRSGRRERSLQLASVARCRLAMNGNWVESRLVEDALTLFDRSGKAMAKVPASATGFEQLLSSLASRNIRIEKVDVDAPVSS